MIGAAANPLGFWPVWLTPQVMWGSFGGLVVLGAGLWLLSTRPSRPRPICEAGRVIGVVGLMGSGKSYMAVRLAAAQLDAGADVASNFSMHLDAKSGGQWRLFRDFADFAELTGDVDPDTGKIRRRMVVIIDEAHLLAPSNEPNALSRVARWKISQARKFGLDIYWISQHESKVAKPLRDLTTHLYVCKSTGRGKGLRFSATAYDPATARKAGKELFRVAYRFEERIARMYDTLEIVEGSDDGAAGRDGQMTRAREIGRAYAARRQGGALAPGASALREASGAPSGAPAPAGGQEDAGAEELLPRWGRQ